MRRAWIQVVQSAMMMSEPPDLLSVASEWIRAGPDSSGIEGVPIDCPSISNVMGSVGSCGPTCPSIAGYNSFTSGPYLQGICGSTLLLESTLLLRSTVRARVVRTARAWTRRGSTRCLSSSARSPRCTKIERRGAKEMFVVHNLCFNNSAEDVITTTMVFCTKLTSSTR